MACAPICTESDVLAGLSQLSVQVHNLSAFIAIAAALSLLCFVMLVVLAFTGQRRG